MGRDTSPRTRTRSKLDSTVRFTARLISPTENSGRFPTVSDPGGGAASSMGLRNTDRPPSSRGNEFYFRLPFPHHPQGHDNQWKIR